MQRMLH